MYSINPDQTLAIDDFIKKILQSTGIPGISIAVINDETVLYERAFGLRNIEKKLPMTTKTVYGIGSISKSFTALAIMQLCEQGKLKLDEPISKFFNITEKFCDNHITIHHLLCHTSGIPELNLSIGRLFQELGVKIETVLPLTVSEMLPLIEQGFSQAIDIPGQTYRYCNEGYILLGEIIKKVSGLNVGDYIRKNIIDPLGLEHSFYDNSIFREEEDRVMGYIPTADGKSLQPVEPAIFELNYACGGIFSNIQAMKTYLQMWFNEGKTQNNEIILKDSIDKMWSRQIPKFEDDLTQHYGYGWQIIDNWFGERIIYHGGDVLTTGGLLLLVPNKKLGIVIGQNGAGNPIFMDLAKFILGSIFGKANEEIFPNEIYKKTMRKIMGKYQTYMGIFKINLIASEGIPILVLKYPGLNEPIMQPLAVEDLDKLKFYVPTTIPGPKARIQFHIEENPHQIWFTYKEYRFDKYE